MGPLSVLRHRPHEKLDKTSCSNDLFELGLGLGCDMVEPGLRFSLLIRFDEEMVIEV